MRHLLILCLGLFLGCSSAQCSTTIFPPLQPVGGSNVLRDYSNSNSNNRTIITQSPLNQIAPDISQIERQLFGRAYASQNLSARLSRIEKAIFTTTYPNANERQRIDNIISNFNQINKYPNISRNVLSRLENKVFNQDFSQNTAQRRIERLEQQIFGAVQGGDIDSRYENLQMAVRNYNNNNTASTDFYNSTPNAGRGWKGIASALGSSILGGSMTGFTPPINQYGYGYNNGLNNYNSGLNGYNNGYNNYNNAYGNLLSPALPSGSGIYRGYRSNTGYYDGYKDYGTGTGVTILD